MTNPNPTDPDFDRLVDDLCEEITIEPGTAEAVVASSWLAGLRRDLLDVTAQRDNAQKRAEEYRAGWKLRGRQLNESDRARYAAEGALVAARTENSLDHQATLWKHRALEAEAELAVARRDAATAALNDYADELQAEADEIPAYAHGTYWQSLNSQIAELRGRASMLASPEPSYDGEICQDCDRPYFRTLWHAPDDLWAQFVDPNGRGLLCPACFSDRVKTSGLVVRFEARPFIKDGEHVTVGATPEKPTP